MTVYLLDSSVIIDILNRKRNRAAQLARFVREGNDIYSTVELTATQAALGATVTIPTLEGDEELALDAGTQPGEINRHDGGRGCYFLDPDGHFLEIITRPYGSSGFNP